MAPQRRDIIIIIVVIIIMKLVMVNWPLLARRRLRSVLTATTLVAVIFLNTHATASSRLQQRPHSSSPPPTLDDLWNGTARFVPFATHAANTVGFSNVNAGTRVVVGSDGTWYLFGRADSGPTPQCPQGEIGINVRASQDLSLIHI